MSVQKAMIQSGGEAGTLTKQLYMARLSWSQVSELASHPVGSSSRFMLLKLE